MERQGDPDAPVIPPFESLRGRRPRRAPDPLFEADTDPGPASAAINAATGVATDANQMMRAILRQSRDLATMPYRAALGPVHAALRQTGRRLAK